MQSADRKVIIHNRRFVWLRADGKTEPVKVPENVRNHMAQVYSDRRGPANSGKVGA